jgi:hypothetical protein
VTPHALEAFDPVDQTLVTGNRDATTVPGQSLFLLNSAFVRKQSLTLAERLLAAKNTKDAERITEAYRLALGRSPNKVEVARAKAFLDEYESAAREFFPDNLAPRPRPVKVAAPKKPDVQLADPDQIDQTGEPVSEEYVRPGDARSAAWLAFVQALFGSAEFRFIR